MNALHELHNISKVIEEKLIEVDIDTPEQLKTMGSKEAFIRIKLKDNSACVNMLFALEGAPEQQKAWEYCYSGFTDCFIYI